MDHIPLTPFGRGPVTLARISEDIATTWPHHSTVGAVESHAGSRGASCAAAMHPGGPTASPEKSSALEQDPADTVPLTSGGPDEPSHACLGFRRNGGLGCGPEALLVPSPTRPALPASSDYRSDGWIAPGSVGLEPCAADTLALRHARLMASSAEGGSSVGADPGTPAQPARRLALGGSHLSTSTDDASFGPDPDRAHRVAPPAPPACDKWALLGRLRTARAAFGLGDRDLAVLSALLSFRPSRDLSDGAPLVVFPSNASLSDRAHGMAESTLRRHLARLVAAGVIVRRDSPNGKRYKRRDVDGRPGQAFGFDLAPLLLAAARIEAEAQVAEAEIRATEDARTRVVLLLRDATRIAALTGAVEERSAEEGASPSCGDDRDTNSVVAELQSIRQSLRRKLPRPALHDLASRLAAILTALTHVVRTRHPSGSDSQTERHHQRTESGIPIAVEAEKVMQETAAHHWRDDCQLDPWRRTADGLPAHRRVRTAIALDEGRVGNGADRLERTCACVAPAYDSDVAEVAVGAIEHRTWNFVPSSGRAKSDQTLRLSSVLSACPTLASYADTAVRNWADLVRLADRIAPWLGIDALTWHVARSRLGASAAAVTLAGMLERLSSIRNAGGYLRALVGRFEAGRFDVISILRVRSVERSPVAS